MVVAEACEFNRAFLDLSPTYSVVTSIDADHIDDYPTEELLEAGFLQFILKCKGTLLLHYTVAERLKKYEELPKDFLTYGLNEGVVTAENLRMGLDKTRFDYRGYVLGTNFPLGVF